MHVHSRTYSLLALASALVPSTALSQSTFRPDALRTLPLDRYGEFVLLKPVFSAANAALWIAGPLMFILGLIVSIFYVRSRKPARPEALSAEEQAEMERILKG